MTVSHSLPATVAPPVSSPRRRQRSELLSSTTMFLSRDPRSDQSCSSERRCDARRDDRGPLWPRMRLALHEKCADVLCSPVLAVDDRTHDAKIASVDGDAGQQRSAAITSRLASVDDNGGQQRSAAGTSRLTSADDNGGQQRSAAGTSRLTSTDNNGGQQRSAASTSRLTSTSTDNNGGQQRSAASTSRLTSVEGEVGQRRSASNTSRLTSGEGDGAEQRSTALTSRLETLVDDVSQQRSISAPQNVDCTCTRVPASGPSLSLLDPADGCDWISLYFSCTWRMLLFVSIFLTFLASPFGVMIGDDGSLPWEHTGLCLRHGLALEPRSFSETTCAFEDPCGRKYASDFSFVASVVLLAVLYLHTGCSLRLENAVPLWSNVTPVVFGDTPGGALCEFFGSPGAALCEFSGSPGAALCFSATASLAACFATYLYLVALVGDRRRSRASWARDSLFACWTIFAVDQKRWSGVGISILPVVLVHFLLLEEVQVRVLGNVQSQIINFVTGSFCRSTLLLPPEPPSSAPPLGIFSCGRHADTCRQLLCAQPEEGRKLAPSNGTGLHYVKQSFQVVLVRLLLLVTVVLGNAKNKIINFITGFCRSTLLQSAQPVLPLPSAISTSRRNRLADTCQQAPCAQSDKVRKRSGLQRTRLLFVKQIVPVLLQLLFIVAAVDVSKLKNRVEMLNKQEEAVEQGQEKQLNKQEEAVEQGQEKQLNKQEEGVEQGQENKESNRQEEAVQQEQENKWLENEGRPPDIRLSEVLMDSRWKILSLADEDGGQSEDKARCYDLRKVMWHLQVPQQESKLRKVQDKVKNEMASKSKLQEDTSETAKTAAVSEYVKRMGVHVQSREATLYEMTLDKDKKDQTKTYALRHTTAPMHAPHPVPRLEHSLRRRLQSEILFYGAKFRLENGLAKQLKLTTEDVVQHLTGRNWARGGLGAVKKALTEICINLDVSKSMTDMVAPTHEVWVAPTSIQGLDIVYVQDYFPVGDMQSFITKFDFGQLLAGIEEGTNEAVFWFHLFAGFTRDLVRAVSRLHSLGYAHRDIKPDNILVVEQQQDEGAGAVTSYRLRLTDFGAALPTNRKKNEEAGGMAWNLVPLDVRYEGTLWYKDPKLLLAAGAGPELSKSGARSTEAILTGYTDRLWSLDVFQSDAWAVGISLYSAAGSVLCSRFFGLCSHNDSGAIKWTGFGEERLYPLSGSKIFRVDSSAVRWCWRRGVRDGVRVADGWVALLDDSKGEQIDPTEGAPVIPVIPFPGVVEALQPSIHFFREFLTALVTHAMTCDQNKRDLDALVKEVDGIVVPHPSVMPLPKFARPPRPPRSPSGSDVPPPSDAPAELPVNVDGLFGERVPLPQPQPTQPLLPPSPVGAPPLLGPMDGDQPGPDTSMRSFLEVPEGMPFLAGRSDEGNNYDADPFADEMVGEEYAETGESRLSPSSFAKENGDSRDATLPASSSSSTPHDVAPATERLAEEGSSAFFAVSDWDWAPAENRDN